MHNLFFLIVGIIISLVGLFLVGFQLKLIMSCNEEVAAKITSIKKDKFLIRGSTRYTYCPVITYEYGGKKYQENASFSSVNSKKYKVGNTILISVNPSNPELFRFNGRFGILITGFVILAVGLLFVIAFFL